MESPFLIESPIGPLQARLSDQGLASVDWYGITASRPAQTPAEREIAQALLAYFQGDRQDFQEFTFDLSSGTPFQQTIWKALLTIPYGETRSYQWLADTIGNPKALRAVGQANGRNPLPIVIPCHRVVNKAGTLGGYALGTEGGLQIKAFLLALEQKHSRSVAEAPQTAFR